MSDYKITNCHIHLFTLDHVPPDFPIPGAGVLARSRWAIAALAWVIRRLPRVSEYGEQLERLGRTIAVGRNKTQEDIFRQFLKQYSRDTRFVVLPMDLAAGGYQEPKTSLRDQHEALYAITRKPEFSDILLPFAKVHPDRADAFDEFRRCIEEFGFHGLKIYPKLGHAPDHKVLMDKVYPYCVDNNLPVMTHCSRGGAFGRGWSGRKGQELGAPVRYVPVLEAFPELRVCLAHFGGSDEWEDYVAGIDPLDPQARERNWVTCICDMIKSGKYPNLYTDISYTMFDFEENMPFLSVFLENDTLRGRVLFGSDYYMTKQEDLSERAVSMRLRHALGAGVYREISEVNPARWLTGSA